MTKGRRQIVRACPRARVRRMRRTRHSPSFGCVRAISAQLLPHGRWFTRHWPRPSTTPDCCDRTRAAFYSLPYKIHTVNVFAKFIVNKIFIIYFFFFRFGEWREPFNEGDILYICIYSWIKVKWDGSSRGGAGRRLSVIERWWNLKATGKKENEWRTKGEDRETSEERWIN